MLYRKTTKAVSTAILTVMALLGGSAHAVIDLDATTAAGVGTITFSKETLGNFAPGTTPANQFHPLYLTDSGTDPDACASASNTTATSTMLAVKTAVGMRIAGGQTRYMRLDLTNMRFRTALTNDNFTDVCLITTAGSTQVAIETGGAVNDTHVILAVSRPAGQADVPATTPVYFALEDHLAIEIDATSGDFTYGAYADVGTAVGRSNALKSATETGVSVAPSMSVKITAGATATADVAVEPRFTDFVDGGKKPLGTVAVSLAAKHLRSIVAGGYVATLNDVQKDGTVTLTAPGGLAFGTFTMNAAADCSGSGARVSVASTGETAGRGTVGVALGTRTLCVAQSKYDHDKDPSTPTQGRVIPETNINAALAFVKNANAHHGPPAVEEQRIGSIDRNGAVVRLPYLTTYDGYNNRIVIVNRGSVNADYELMFTPEVGVTATAGHMATGTVMAGKTMVISVSDAVTLENGSRTAATLAIVAPETLVDVATTIVNKDDKSTDTVTYDVN